MSTEKSFLDDNGLQRLWQKVTATVTNSVSAAINALPSWAKADTKPSYTVSEIKDAVSDEDFVKHVNSNLHVSNSDREVWDDVTRYHKYKYDLPDPGSNNKYVSFSQGYVNTDYSIFAIDGTGHIVYCPNASESWYGYPTQLSDNCRYNSMYQIAIFNSTIYVSFNVRGSGTQLWKLSDDAFLLVEEESTSNHLPMVYSLLAMNYGSSEQLFLIGFDNTSPSNKRAIYRLDSSDELYQVAMPDDDIHVFSKAKVSSDKNRAILYDDQNGKLMVMMGGEFPSSGYEISIPSGTTISNFCALNDGRFNVFCLVVDYPAKKLYNADFLAGSLMELYDNAFDYWDKAPYIAAYQENVANNAFVLLMGGVNCRYSNAYPYDTYSRSGIGGTANNMDDIQWLEYCPYSSMWFAITASGKCITSSDPTAAGTCWENFTPYLLDKDDTDISGSIRDIIGAMSHDEVVSLVNQVTDGFVKYNAEQSLTDAQKTQARSNIGAVGSDDITSLDPRGPWKFGGKITKPSDSIVFYTPPGETSAKKFSGVVNEFIFKINSITRKSGYDSYRVIIATGITTYFNRNGTESSFTMRIDLNGGLAKEDDDDAFIGSCFHFEKRYVQSACSVYEPAITSSDGVSLTAVTMPETMNKAYLVNMKVGLIPTAGLTQYVDAVDIDFWYR